MCSESLGSEKVSYGPCAHQESCESLAAMAKFLVIRFDRSLSRKHKSGGLEIFNPTSAVGICLFFNPRVSNLRLHLVRCYVWGPIRSDLPNEENPSGD